MNKQILTFLGRGGAFNASEGNNSAYILEDNILFLIDCGEDVFGKLIRGNILKDVNEINVYITHLHSDHYGSLSSLLYYAKYVSKTPINIYTGSKNLSQALQFSGNNEADYTLHIMYDRETVTLSNNLSFTQIPISHTTELIAKGLILQYKDYTIYYSGDCNEVIYEALYAINSNPKTQYYQDTTLYDVAPHLNINKLINATSPEQRKNIYCMHLEGEDIIPYAYANGLNVVSVDNSFQYR